MGRGLSTDEKRVKLLEIFHETKDFYQLKELEKLAPKMKGIVSQSVKEVLQGLLDDGMVQSDKVGSSNFFWSFPSQRGGVITAKVNTAKAMRHTTQTNISELKNLIEQEKVVRPDSTERTDALAALASKKKDIAESQKEMAQYGACDPAQVEARKRGIVLAHEAAVRWTDNISMMRSNFLKRTGADSEQLQAYLGICDMDEFEDIS